MCHELQSYLAYFVAMRCCRGDSSISQTVRFAKRAGVAATALLVKSGQHNQFLEYAQDVHVCLYISAITPTTEGVCGALLLDAKNVSDQHEGCSFLGFLLTVFLRLVQLVRGK
jgi:hypothetical protein